MGTRCLTVFRDDETFGGKTEPREIVVLYRQYDGNPDGHGKELSKFLKGKQIVNGLSGDYSKLFNGMGCLAASVVAHFKEGPGSFYLYPAGTRDCGEEYIYTVSGKAGMEPVITVTER